MSADDPWIKSYDSSPQELFLSDSPDDWIYFWTVYDGEGSKYEASKQYGKWYCSRKLGPKDVIVMEKINRRHTC